MAARDLFHEKNWSAVPIRDLGLSIAGTALEPVILEFEREIEQLGLAVKPRFYLSTDWGVVTGTVAIGIPFYLAHPELTHFHAERVGFIEGYSRADILRYLRHEMGHVVNYAYLLHEQDEWARLFGRYDQPYVENYKPSPFSRRFVQHLPGWYAQKHPDEDWAETFAVWMTPGVDWREEYADQPAALAKLEYCDRTMARLRESPPLETSAHAEEDVAELPFSLEQYYGGDALSTGEFPRLFDGALRAIFEEFATDDSNDPPIRQRASALMTKLERELMANVYRWTGHFPERTRSLLRHLAARADVLGLTYAPAREAQAAIGLTTFVSALAMNYVHSGNYLP
jgi:hypothetical protein